MSPLEYSNEMKTNTLFSIQLHKAKAIMHTDDIAVSFSSSDLVYVRSDVNVKLATAVKWHQGNKLSFKTVKTQTIRS